MIWWQTQLSCIYHVNAHDEHFLVRILRTSWGRLIQPVKMYINWYMMWYLKKDMFCKEHDLFRWFIIFKTICLSSIFWSVWPSSVVQRTRSTWNSLAYFVRTWNFTIVCAIVFSDHVHDRTNDLFSRSRVRTPGLARNLFCRSRVWFPDLAAWSFCGSRVWFPDPITCFRPIVSVAYVICPHD